MKKSELKALIKEMLREELAAMDKPSESGAATNEQEPEAEVLEEETLTETPVLDRPNTRTNNHGVRAGTYADVAVNIQLTPEFEDAYYIDGTVYGEEVAEVIDTAVTKAYPSLDQAGHEKAVIAVRAELAKIMSSSDAYSDDAAFDYDSSDDEILDSIYSTYFDGYGNEY